MRVLTIIIFWAFCSLNLSGEINAQEVDTVRISYLERSKAHRIVIDHDIDSLFFDILWIDRDLKTIHVDYEQMKRYSDRIKAEYPDNICYLKMEISNFADSLVYIQGKLKETEYKPIMGGPAIRAFPRIDMFKFAIRLLNVNSAKIIKATIVSEPIKTIVDTIDFKYKILKIDSEPEGAEIFFNSTKTNRITPAEFTGLNDDSVLVQLQKSGYQDTSFVVVLIDDETDSLIKLKRNQMVFTDTVVVHTEPQNSDIFINGDFEGTTPDTLFGLNDTTFLKLVQKGYKDTTLTVRSKPDSMIRVIVKMEKKKPLDNHPWVFYSLSGLGVVSSIVYFVYQHENPKKYGPTPDLADPPGWP